MIDEFAQNEAIQSINEKISAASTVMNGKLSLSADQGVQNSWESSLVTQVDGIPFAHAGKGAQCIIKTQLALSHKQAEKASIILIEEPESHLSFSRLSELMGVIEKAASGRQIIASTHSSFVANKLGLENLILLSGDNCCSMQSLKKETFEFFKKVAGYDTLRLILCKKSILVEGDSDELVVQRAYMDTHEGRLPIQDGIDVMTVGGVTFKRYLEIAQTLNKETAVVTDNDGNIEAVKKKYKEYEEMTLVGDPRQTTYRTHYEAKYKKYAGGKIVIFVQDNIAGMNIDTTTLSTSHRNNQIICDLANQMYPDMKPCDSAMNEKTGHDGIFWVHENDIDKYVDIYNPVQLRYDKRTKVNPIPKTMNFGLSKGLTFNRVLIYPTKPMLDWLSGKSKDMKDESLSKFYVAVTRARYSVAFVYKTKRLPTNDIGTKWTPDVLE
nr:TOPRIM nucleotidyl transferase/hydrolase domain-containing protein [uncultured Blautia sp.]